MNCGDEDGWVPATLWEVLDWRSCLAFAISLGFWSGIVASVMGWVPWTFADVLKGTLDAIVALAVVIIFRERSFCR